MFLENKIFTVGHNHIDSSMENYDDLYKIFPLSFPHWGNLNNREPSEIVTINFTVQLFANPMPMQHMKSTPDILSDFLF